MTLLFDHIFRNSPPHLIPTHILITSNQTGYGSAEAFKYVVIEIRPTNNPFFVYQFLKVQHNGIPYFSTCVSLELAHSQPSIALSYSVPTVPLPFPKLFPPSDALYITCMYIYICVYMRVCACAS